MADNAQMPSLADLQGIYGAWNPQAYLQAQENLGLGQQFQQQALQQQRNVTQEGTLKNLFAEQNNPAKLQEQLLTNTGKQTSNEVAGLGLERAKANQSNLLSEDQRRAALGATEDEMKAWDQHVYQMMRSPNPQDRQEAMQMQQLMPAFQEARRKHQEELDKTKLQTGSAEKIEGMRTGSAQKIAQMNIDAGKYVKTPKGGQGIADIQSAVQTGKMTAEKAAVALHGAAMFTEDPEQAQKYRDMASQYEQFAMNQRNAAAGGKPDLAQMGIPTQPIAPALGTIQQAAPKIVTTLPEGAKKIGTSNGSPVYQLPDGRKFIGQ